MLKKILFLYWRLVNLPFLEINCVKYSRTTRIFGRVLFKCEKKNLRDNHIVIGKDVTINSGQKYNMIGGDSTTVLRTIGKGKIIIGDRVGLSNVAIVASKKVVVENDVLLGGGVKIYDSDFHSLSYFDRVNDPYMNIKTEQITIKEGAFIGANVIILKGVTIGKHSVIGAGSVVSKSIPDNEIWAGNPAIFIRKITN